MLGDERGRWLLDAAHADSATELALSGPYRRRVCCMW
jgi:hypothetical protein